MDNYMKRYEIEKDEEWREWMGKIPSLTFPDDWKVKIIPPFGGAMARFLIDKGKAHVSVYLDCYDRLGFVGQPYWELYPYQYEDYSDVYRVMMDETDELMQRISESLEKQEDK